MRHSLELIYGQNAGLGVSHVAAKVGRKNAAIAASTRTPYSGRLAVLTVETTASWPSKAAVTESTDERSAVRTVTESGKLAEEDGRLTTVTLNFPDLTSALRTALREIQRRVGKDHGCQFSQQRLRPGWPPTPTIATFLITAII